MPAPTPEDLAAGVPTGANIVKRVPAPSGKGELLLDANGGVYDTGGQSFSGSYFSLPPEARQGGNRTFRDIVVDPKTGGYKLVTDTGGGPTEGQGSGYDFGPSDYVKNMPRANPLYSDPAFLAFIANSGMDYEAAANDVQRRKAALQNALSLQVPDIQKQGENQLKSIYGDFASRGLYGSGQQAEKEGEAQANTLSQVAKAQGDTANQIADLQGGLATKRSGILADAASKGYGTAGTQDLTAKLGDVDKRYPLGDQTGLKY